MVIPTRCCICKGCRQVGVLRDLMYAEPWGGNDTRPAYVRGWMCEECAIVHWALPAEGWKEEE